MRHDTLEAVGASTTILTVYMMVTDNCMTTPMFLRLSLVRR